MLTGTKTSEIAPPAVEWSRSKAASGRLRTLAGHQLASFVSGAVDFLTMIAFVRWMALSPTLATVFGAAAGAVVNYSLGRSVVFPDHAGDVGPQMARYALVSATSLLLNAFGEYVLAERLGVQYVLARAVIALSVSVLWNFPLQRHFVFRRASASPAGHGSCP